MIHEADVCQAFKSKRLRNLAMRRQIKDASRLGWKHQLVSVVGSPSVLALYPKQSSLGVRFVLLDKSK